MIDPSDFNAANAFSRKYIDISSIGRCIGTTIITKIGCPHAVIDPSDFNAANAYVLENTLTYPVLFGTHRSSHFPMLRLNDYLIIAYSTNFTTPRFSITGTVGHEIVRARLDAGTIVQVTIVRALFALTVNLHMQFCALAMASAAER